MTTINWYMVFTVLLITYTLQTASIASESSCQKVYDIILYGLSIQFTLDIIDLISMLYIEPSTNLPIVYIRPRFTF